MASRYLQWLIHVHYNYKQDKKQAFRLCGGAATAPFLRAAWVRLTNTDYRHMTENPGNFRGVCIIDGQNDFSFN